MGLTAEAHLVKGLARVKGAKAERERGRETGGDGSFSERRRGEERWLECFCFEKKMPRTDRKPKQSWVTSEQGYLIY